LSQATLSLAIADYLETRFARFAPSTVEQDVVLLRRFSRDVAAGRDIQVRHLTSDHVERWFLALRREHRDANNRVRPPITASTWNFYRSRILGFATYLARRGLTRHDLLRDVHPMRSAQRIRQQPGLAVLRAMLEGAPDPRDRAVLAVAMNTGLRAAEISRLRVGDLNLSAGDLRVWVSKSQVEDLMPVTADLDQEMRRWLCHYAAVLGRPTQASDHLLPVALGPRYRWRTLSDGARERYQVDAGYDPTLGAKKLERVVQRVLHAQGLETRHEGIHTIRRAVARAFYESVRTEGHEFAIRQVMVLLHHSNQSTTERYLGLSAEKEARDLSLRGKSFLGPDLGSNVIPLRRDA
jgi:integrase